MPEAFAAPTSLLLGWLLTYTLHSTVLICAAWVIMRVIDLQPSTRDFLWRAAVLGGIVTATGVLSVPRSGPRVDFERVGELHAASQAPPVTDELRWRGAQREVRVRAQVASPSPECRAAIRRGAPGAPGWIEDIERHCAVGAGLSWYQGLLLLWIVGAAFGVLRLGRAYRAAAMLRRSLGDATPRARSILEALSGPDLGVRVMASAELPSPCFMGSSTIGLPLRCEDELSDAELRAVLAHELAHVARRDFQWTGLLRALSAVLWLQPLNRLATARALEAAELSCDDWALAKTGERAGLATSIERVAAWAVPWVESPAVVSMASRRSGAISGRVRRIARGGSRRDPTWRKVLVGVTIALPVPFLPAVSAPSSLHAAIFVESDDVITAPGELTGLPQGSIRRVVVARVE